MSMSIDQNEILQSKSLNPTQIDIEQYSIGNIVRRFNEIDIGQTGSIDETQLVLLLQEYYQKQIDVYLYLNNLMLQSGQLYTLDDLLMLITDITYYDQLRESVLERKQQMNLNQLQCKILLCQLEKTQRDQRKISFLQNPLINEQIKMIKDYQKKCKDANQYDELEKSELKIQQIIKKQNTRWNHYIAQFKKYQQLTIASKSQQTQQQQQEQWEQFITDFQNNKYYKFNRIKEEQKQQLKSMSETIKEGLQFRMTKLPKQVLELRQKEQTLVKLKLYRQAEEVKDQADSLELQERRKIERQIIVRTKKKVKIIKKQQEQSLNAFKQKIESDRISHMLQRQQCNHSINRHLQLDTSSTSKKDVILYLASRRTFSTEAKNRSRIKSAYANDIIQFADQSYNKIK